MSGKIMNGPRAMLKERSTWGKELSSETSKKRFPTRMLRSYCTVVVGIVQHWLLMASSKWDFSVFSQWLGDTSNGSRAANLSSRTKCGVERQQPCQHGSLPSRGPGRKA